MKHRTTRIYKRNNKKKEACKRVLKSHNTYLDRLYSLHKNSVHSSASLKVLRMKMRREGAQYIGIPGRIEMGRCALHLEALICR